ncbi:hypothetical protein AMECASPLE_026186 [Ameca splendens]|uniref:Uncharacterized protein n=1 Tax=Ameca splendens TaxID=208324 RepID=A0ABV0ZR45_9TELE
MQREVLLRPEALGSLFLFLYFFVLLLVFLLFEALNQYRRAEFLELGKNSRPYGLPKVDYIPPEMQRIMENLHIPPLWPKRGDTINKRGVSKAACALGSKQSHTDQLCPTCTWLT